MKLFDKWIHDQYVKMCKRQNPINAMLDTKAHSGHSPQLNNDNSLNFTIHKATGGLVIDTYHFDQNHNRQSNLHIIKSTDDNNEIMSQLANIIMLETLRK